jgi:hypothetical protein
MSNSETTNLGWQVQQFQQRATEWIEFNLESVSQKVIDSGLKLPEWLYDLLVWIAWIIFSLTIAWIGLLIFRLIRGYILSFSRQGKNWGIIPNPLAVPIYSVDQWLKKARTFQLAGNYTEACRCLYMGMLQLLSDRQIIPQQYSRTDGEYRNLLSNLPQSQAYQVLLNTHEQLCFSDRQISSENFHTCQTAYSEIQQTTSGQS